MLPVAQETNPSRGPGIRSCGNRGGPEATTLGETSRSSLCMRKGGRMQGLP